MKLILTAEKRIWRSDETIVVRLLVLNESFETAVLDRRLLIGPNLLPGPGDRHSPIQVEPAFAQERDNLIVLNPFCLYGRQRSFSVLPVGQKNFGAYLCSNPVESLLPQGPTDTTALLAEAEPLVLTIQETI